MVDLGHAAGFVLKSPLAAVSGVVDLAEYVHLRRQYSRALRLVVGCVIKNIEDRRDLNGAIEKFTEDTDERSWRLVVKKAETGKRNVDRYIRHLPSIAPIVVSAHFEVFCRIEEFFCSQRNIFAKIIENGNKRHIDLNDVANGLKLCQRALKKSERRHFGSDFDILKEIERIGQFRISIHQFAKQNKS